MVAQNEGESRLTGLCYGLGVAAIGSPGADGALAGGNEPPALLLHLTEAATAAVVQLLGMTEGRHRLASLSASLQQPGTVWKCIEITINGDGHFLQIVKHKSFPL
jgi:hypothetical protein